MAAVFEEMRVAGCGNQSRSGDRANTGDGHQAVSGIVGFDKSVNLLIQSVNALVDVVNVVEQIPQQRFEQCWEVVVGQERREQSDDFGNALWNHDAEFMQVATDLIGFGGALGDTLFADAVHHQGGLLLLGLDGDEAHIGAAGGLANGLCIVIVVLLIVAVGDDELG